MFHTLQNLLHNLRIPSTLSSFAFEKILRYIRHTPGMRRLHRHLFPQHDVGCSQFAYHDMYWFLTPNKLTFADV